MLQELTRCTVCLSSHRNMQPQLARGTNCGSRARRSCASRAHRRHTGRVAAMKDHGLAAARRASPVQGPRSEESANSRMAFMLDRPGLPDRFVSSSRRILRRPTPRVRAMSDAPHTSSASEAAKSAGVNASGSRRTQETYFRRKQLNSDRDLMGQQNARKALPASAVDGWPWPFGAHALVVFEDSSCSLKSKAIFRNLMKQ